MTETTSDAGDSPACPKCGAPLDGIADVNGMCASCILEGAPEHGHELRPPPPEEISDLLPGLTIDRLIGYGAMGAVYRARHHRLDRDVAVKLLLRNPHSPEALRRFAREGRALAALSHPNLVTIYESNEESGLAFLVMECIDGMGLDRYLETNGVDIEQALDMVEQACKGLEYAHERGVIHRDLKPANLILAEDGTVKVVDFGLAKFLEGVGIDRSVTLSGVVVGTFGYMAPEQMEASLVVDGRADVYSLGAVLFKMLTGEAPTGAIRLDSFPKDSPLWVKALVLKALARQADERFSSVGEMREAIEEGRAGEFEKVSKQMEALATNTSSLPKIIVLALAVVALVVGGIALYLNDQGNQRETAIGQGVVEPAAAPIRIVVRNNVEHSKPTPDLERVAESLERSIGREWRIMVEELSLDASQQQQLAHALASFDEAADKSLAVEVGDERPMQLVPTMRTNGQFGHTIRSLVGDEKSDRYWELKVPLVVEEVLETVNEAVAGASSLPDEDEIRKLYDTEITEQAARFGSIEPPLQQCIEEWAEEVRESSDSHPSDSMLAEFAVGDLKDAALYAATVAATLPRSDLDSREQRFRAWTVAGLQFLSQGRDREALSAHQKAGEEIEFDDDPGLWIRNRMNQADLLASLGEHQKAELILRPILTMPEVVEALELLDSNKEGTFRISPGQIGSAYHDLASILFEDGREEEALPLLREAVRIEQKVYGARSGDVPPSLNLLGQAQLALGLEAEAEENLLLAMEIAVENHGEEHWMIDRINVNLANLQSRRGQEEEALALRQEVLKSRLKMFPEGHRDLDEARHNTALSLFRLGRYPEAAPISRKATASARVRYGNDSFSLVPHLTLLGAILRRDPEHGEEAVAISQEIVNLREQDDWENDLSLPDDYRRLAGALVQQDKMEEALEAYARSLERAETIGISEDRLGRIANDYGLALLNAGKTEEAVPVFKRAEIAYSDGGDSARLAEAMFNVVVAQRKSVGAESAIPKAREALAVGARLKSLTPPEEHPLFEEHKKYYLEMLSETGKEGEQAQQDLDGLLKGAVD